VSLALETEVYTERQKTNICDETKLRNLVSVNTETEKKRKIAPFLRDDPKGIIHPAAERDSEFIEKVVLPKEIEEEEEEEVVLLRQYINYCLNGKCGAGQNVTVACLSL
jgi:hypothetical protein